MMIRKGREAHLASSSSSSSSVQQIKSVRLSSFKPSRLGAVPHSASRDCDPIPLEQCGSSAPATLARYQGGLSRPASLVQRQPIGSPDPFGPLRLSLGCNGEAARDSLPSNDDAALMLRSACQDAMRLPVRFRPAVERDRHVEPGACRRIASASQRGGQVA